MNTYRLVLNFKYAPDEKMDREIIFRSFPECPFHLGSYNKYFLENKLTDIQERCLKSILNIRDEETISEIHPCLVSFNFHSFIIPIRNW